MSQLGHQERTEEDVWVPALAKSLISTVIYWASFVSRGLYSGSDFTVYYELFLVVSTGTFYEILNIILLISPIATSSVYHVTKHPFRSLLTNVPLSPVWA